MAAIIQPTALLTCFHSLHFPSKPPLIVPLHTCLFKPKQQHHHQPRFSVSTAQSLLSSNPTLSSHRNIEPLFGLHSKYDTFIDIGIDHLLNLLRISVRYTDFDLARALHASILKLGEDTHLGNALVVAYLKLGLVLDAYEVFKGLCNPDVVSYSSLISSFAKGNQEMKAIELFFRMRSSAYMEFGLVDLAVEVFEKMPERNSVSYNALLAGFCNNGEGLKALDLFIKMVQEGAELSEFTLTSVITACGILRTLEISRQIHGFIMKFGFGSNACIETALLDMYTRCGRMNDADKMFRSWPSDRDSLVIQTSMLCGYARNGMPNEAVSLFQLSLSEGTMVVDEVALTSVLGVCGTLGSQEMGEQIHCHALKTGFLADLGVGNSIISMYSKCCNMNKAIKSFNDMLAHDVVSWNCLIAGHLLHRQGDEALAVWSRMEKAAYSHTRSDLVEDCRDLFFSMKNIYEVEPTSEHYASFKRITVVRGGEKEKGKVGHVAGVGVEVDVGMARSLNAAVQGTETCQIVRLQKLISYRAALGLRPLKP
ncbi:pentatricopeptide repeat-containing protein, putative [Ricinus communis]|uniref:Pentatricopeptide repeat-containing protein, putative n=1 Tax=Ricinus communis TaxID=3988 RepID=B9SRK7_RICCO|nr:pentatricopeptide repeat-containing protein, putative [Ricinus communis]